MADVTELRPSTTPAPEGADLVTYAFVITLQVGLPHGRGYAIFERSGTWNALRGSSRNEVYKTLRQEVVEEAERQGLSGSSQTIFWSLERDTLL